MSHHHLTQPSPYILAFSPQAVHPRSISSPAAIAAEVATPDRDGWQRVLVLRSLEPDVAAVVDGRRAVGWSVPGEVTAMVWRVGYVAVVLVEKSEEGFEGGLGHLRVRYRSKLQMTPLEERLWDALPQDKAPEDIIAETIFTFWLDHLPSASTPPSPCLIQALDHNATSALLTNTTSPRPPYAALLARLHHRQALLTPQPSDANARSLDRIAYLGGLLLPLTVVSGVLSIEGAYGPGGRAFWVFWLAAGVSSLVALMVIYADHVRCLDVWIEEEMRGRERRAKGVSRMVVATGREGGRRWRRKRLGWVGAVKKMSGWYWWRGSPGLRWRMPEEREESSGGDVERGDAWC